jgi:hypothetical protein
MGGSQVFMHFGLAGPGFKEKKEYLRNQSKKRVRKNTMKSQVIDMKKININGSTTIN